jgi:hypothetical protein
MRLIAVFNLPAILLALVVGAAAAPSGADAKPDAGLFTFCAFFYTVLFD